MHIDPSPKNKGCSQMNLGPIFYNNNIYYIFFYFGKSNHKESGTFQAGGVKSN